MSGVIPFDQRPGSMLHRETHGWSVLTRILFRLSSTYLALSAWFWLFEFADKSLALLARPYNALWHPFAQWTAVHIFHWSGFIEPNFVRDTRYLYALLTCFLVLSVLATLIWSVLDRKRTEYTALNYWMRIFLRYVLAYLLLHYGVDKVFLLQFPAPSLARLTERFGDYSPSSLMWAFIGSSVVYTIFGGLAEILGAVLLFARRTTTLGALIAFAVMFNVTVMDFSYDVAVKIFCLNILLMATYLIVPDAQRLLNFFILNRPTQPVLLKPAMAGDTGRRSARLIQVLVILFLILPLTYRSWKNYHVTGAAAPHPPLYGLYEVKDFTLAGVEHPPLLTDTARWRYVILEEPNILTLKHMDDSLTSYYIRYDASQHLISLTTPGSPAEKSSLHVTDTNTNTMTLQGTFQRTPILVTLTRVDRGSFTLVNRGFHWISESSFVR